MVDKDKIIEGLRAELDSLKSELEKAKEREKDYEEARTAMLYILEDINKSTAEIERSKKEWEATFDAISAPLFIHDKEFKIVKANAAYQRAAGMKFKELIDKPYYEVFPRMDGPFKMCLEAEEFQAEEEFSYPVANSIFKVRLYPIKDAEGKYLYSIHIMEDITEAKRAEEKIKQEMEITAHLLMISEATADTTDIDRLMGEVVHCGHKITGCDICLSYLWDKERRVFRPSQAYGLNHGMTPSFKTEVLDEKMEFVKKAMKKEEPLTLPSPLRGEDKGEGAFNWLPDINTLVLIPLIGKEDYLGLIVGIYKRLTEPTERDEKIMKGIAYQVSIALEEARLYRDSIDKAMELSNKIETIQVMHEIDRSILSTLRKEDILEIAIMMASRIVPCDRATVALVDNEKKGLVFAAEFGAASSVKGAFVPFGDTTATEVIKTHRPQYVANIREIKNPSPLEDRFYKEGFLSHIRIPLIVKGEVVGILTLGSKRPSAFTHEVLSTVEKVAMQIGVALENARLVEDIEALFLGTVKSLSSAIDAKSPWTAGHSDRVTKYAISIGKEMSFSENELRDLELGGLLHDIGKLGTYETILDKPEKLSDEEFKLIKLHPIKGAEILSPIKQIRHIIPIVRHHHEFYNGRGYPDGLKGDEIPLMARIMCIADSVDAMGADRPYRKGRPMDDIIAEVKRCSGTQFDPNVSEVFLKIGILPEGVFK